MVQWLKITLLVTIISSIVSSAIFYAFGKRHGLNEANADCRLSLYQLQEAVNNANMKVIDLSNKQRDSFRLALDIRNKQFTELENNLVTKEQRLRGLISGSEDICVNTPIPDGFK